ncbi:MAG: hypothetical protein WA988_16795, partial [Candidatus Nanopelagicales bacterium]
MLATIVPSVLGWRERQDEHTGLLKRAPREDLEAAFKAGTAPDAPNVLTATPTLEMGIDIGDLSSVMLTS